ncbi:MAG: hypothetical protein WC003_17515 [Terrimicrobiaceae bacterium]
MEKHAGHGAGQRSGHGFVKGIFHRVAPDIRAPFRGHAQFGESAFDDEGFRSLPDLENLAGNTPTQRSEHDRPRCQLGILAEEDFDFLRRIHARDRTTVWSRR